MSKRRHPDFATDLEGDIFCARKALWLDAFRSNTGMRLQLSKFDDWLTAQFPGADKKVPRKRLEWIRENARRSAEAEFSRI